MSNFPVGFTFENAISAAECPEFVDLISDVIDQINATSGDRDTNRILSRAAGIIRERAITLDEQQKKENFKFEVAFRMCTTKSYVTSADEMRRKHAEGLAYARKLVGQAESLLMNYDIRPKPQAKLSDDHLTF